MTKDNQKSSVQAIILIVAVFCSFKQTTSAAIGDLTNYYNDAERLRVKYKEYLFIIFFMFKNNFGY